MNPDSPPLKILYRDAQLLAAHKPEGIATYRESHGRGADGLKELLEESLNQRLFPVHRIDADTSGLVAFALDPKSAASMIRAFREHKIRKTYSAWCTGELSGSGSIKTPLRKHKSKETESARTDYRALKHSRGATLLEIMPFTGRFHQIRRHFDSIGHPLVGDPLYGNPESWSGFFKTAPRLMLQAQALEFPHPKTGKIQIIRTKIPLSI
jgi:RluA family pseudouridine synthase